MTYKLVLLFFVLVQLDSFSQSSHYLIKSDSLVIGNIRSKESDSNLVYQFKIEKPSKRIIKELSATSSSRSFILGEIYGTDKNIFEDKLPISRLINDTTILLTDIYKKIMRDGSPNNTFVEHQSKIVTIEKYTNDRLIWTYTLEPTRPLYFETTEELFIWKELYDQKNIRSSKINRVKWAFNKYVFYEIVFNYYDKD